MPFSDRIRRAGPADAPAIAALFRAAYGDSSHPCTEVAEVWRTLLSDDHLWIVCEDRGAIVAVTCARRVAWNRSYETCYSITVPAHRGRGLAKLLFRIALDSAERRSDCDLIASYPRNDSMLRLMTSSALIAVGHDGGMNVANGQREVHTITIGKNPRTNPVRVAPPAGAPRWVDALGFASAPGTYPAALVAGSGLGRAVVLDGHRLTYLHDPTSPSGAVLVTGLSSADAAPLERAFARAPYVGVHVLADKLAQIERLLDAGFAFTAYLPAWHHERDRRYDCVMLVKARFASHGLAAAA